VCIYRQLRLWACERDETEYREAHVIVGSVKHMHDFTAAPEPRNLGRVPFAFACERLARSLTATKFDPSRP